MEIFYWSDYACPYCYIGETNLKAALRELGIDCRLEMRAFELSPGAARTCPGPTRDLVAKKYGLTPEQAEESIQSVNKMAAEAGIPFDFGATHASNTFDAHRLTKLAAEQSAETADALTEELFRAAFFRGEEMSDPEVLCAAARAVGMEESRVRAVLASDEFAEAVREDERAAHSVGVTSVPFFVINGEFAIPGALDKNQFARLLKKLRNREIEG